MWSLCNHNAIVAVYPQNNYDQMFSFDAQEEMWSSQSLLILSKLVESTRKHAKIIIRDAQKYRWLILVTISFDFQM